MEKQQLSRWHARLRHNLIRSTIGIVLWSVLVLAASFAYLQVTHLDPFQLPFGRLLGAAALAPLVLTVVLQRRWLHCPCCGRALEVHPFQVPRACAACGTAFVEE